jgi:cytosine/adenosine deaminase-related metal-dependent hydrolase
MLLFDINIIGRECISHIYVKDGKIRNIASDKKLLPQDTTDFQLILHGALAFPGLINSHDHLDFNLFPGMGNKIYRNYIEWGADIQLANKEQINRILRIPEPLRIRWGVYKNLFAGVTTVVNHGKKIPAGNELINIFQGCQSIHSVQQSKNWKFQLNRLYNKGKPVAIHIGEGTDISVQQETDHLIKWNYFKRHIIGIHGVAMNEMQASSFKALVWCPASNYFLFDKTAPIDTLKRQTAILFGTDSTLTASWNIWDHLRLARSTKLVTDTELFDMLTITAAKTWSMNDTGCIKEDQWADIVIAKPANGTTGWDSFYQLNPEDILLVLHRGSISLFDAALIEQVKNTGIHMAGFSKIMVNGSIKYVRGDVPGLMKEISTYNPDINFPVTVE